MEVTIKRINDAFHFEAMGVSGVANHMDANPEIGGVNAGARPMEMLLMGLGGCTAIDVLLILKKQRQIVDDLEIRVTGDRVKIEGTEMSPFRKIHVHFLVKGAVEASKVDKAIQLSMEKYCSATAQLQSSAEITSSFEVLS
ncbi:MAG: OsmC family protein [Spirosomataceae bacterium]